MFRPHRDKLKKILGHGNIDDLEELVTFPWPWTEVPGPHGRQPGRYESAKGQGPPIYMIEILFQMQEQGILPYLQIVPPSENPGQPAHPKTIIMRGMEDPDEDHFLADFTRKERELLKDWKYSIRNLDGSQIRALGTHVDLRETIADVYYEFDKAIPFCTHIVDRLRENSCFLDDSYNLSRFSREADRKSRTNRNDYKNARKHMMDNIRTDELHHAFELSHKEDSEIWETVDMSDFGTISRQAWAVARYMECVAYYRNNIDARRRSNSKKDLRISHQWNECCPEVRTCKIQSLPTEIAYLFDGTDGDVKPEIRGKMIEVIDDLNGKMNGMVKRFRYA